MPREFKAVTTVVNHTYISGPISKSRNLTFRLFTKLPCGSDTRRREACRQEGTATLFSSAKIVHQTGKHSCNQRGCCHPA